MRTLKAIFIFFLLTALAQAQTFDPSRVRYDIEYKPKPVPADTAITIPDSTGFIDVDIEWDAPTRFANAQDSSIVYDQSGGWISLEIDYSRTSIRKIIEIKEKTYSFRIWSKYVAQSGNILKAPVPSPEYVVRFRTEAKPPAPVSMPVRFKIQQ